MLEKYQKKRDFRKTGEPRGKKQSTKGSGLAFMIHKHHSSHLHYDLRLELDGVLKSWAVPKGPNMHPEDKRLAMMVEDHPYEYKDFEWVIPTWAYGAGPTLIWDQGTYTPKDDRWDKKANEELIRKKLEKWHLSFRLSGKKLHGAFDLIHMRSRGEHDKKDNAWLLVKSEDEFADTEIENADRSVVSGLTIEELRESKLPSPLRALTPDPSPRGRGEKIVISDGKQWKLPRDVKPMLATLVDKPFDDEGWIFEIKWDGYRAIAEIDDGETHLYSRNGISFDTKFSLIREELRDYPDAVFDGEIVAFDADMRANFGLLQGYPQDNGWTLGYYVFDLLYYDGRLLIDPPLIKRKEILREVLRPSEHVKYADHIEERGKEFFALAKKQKLEGIIGKKRDNKYLSGVRSPSWVKIKNILIQEAIICGYTAPRRSRKEFGALILGAYQDGKLRYIGHTGSGFDDTSLTEIKKLLDQYATEVCPFEIVPKTNEKPTWIKPRLVCEVKFQEWTKDLLMRQPIFLGMREDKEPEEVVIEKAPPRPDSRDTPQEGNSHAVHFTHLDKIYFPEDALTKWDIIEYYQKISSYILPYLMGRPETLLRYPDGIHGESFYQKNLPKKGLPSGVSTEDIYSESENRMLHYAVCQNTDGLLYLANLGCIDLHPWSSRTGSLDYPDYIIFDFDPEDIGFGEVVKAAQVTHEILDAIGAPAFCKTSGATGIHIIVPTGSRYTYEQAASFAKLINTVVHARLPDTTSLERLPKKRQKRVYLDYLQNRRWQTIASVYSIRPRVRAPVSTPIKWSELNARLNPLKFNIHTIFKRLEKVWDLWEGMLEQSFDMEKSIRKLERILG